MQSSSPHISNESSWGKFGVLDLKIWPLEVEVPSRSIIKPWKSSWFLFQFLRESWPISSLETYFIIFHVKLNFQRGIVFSNPTPGSQVMASRSSSLNNHSSNSWVNLNSSFSFKISNFLGKYTSHMHGAIGIWSVYNVNSTMPLM
jgi:hypothetical protein